MRGLCNEKKKRVLFTLLCTQQLGKYTGTADAFKKIIAAEGSMALFNGLEATMWRHGVWNGAYFGLIYKVKDMLPKSKVKQKKKLQYKFLGQH